MTGTRLMRLAEDPAFQETHFIAIDFEGTTPKGTPPEPIEVAALGIEHMPGRGPVVSGFQFQSLIRPPEHAPVTARDTAQTGITAADVAHAPDAATVLHDLDQALPGRPRVLVAHHAPVEAGFIYRHRDHCPRLAYTRLICTRRLARCVWPGLPAYGLDALLAHAGIPQPANRHRAMDDVAVTAALFRHLVTEAARNRTLTTLADLVRAAGVQPRAAAATQLELS
ncbi:PolC-type DNA polymerase III [Streptomyces sp. MNP-20]|uniref:3'-5' exonuclease n=1 Tax=Streptomyces sp. MNP-20 TaxID=2721165 RepID=UPI0020A6486A|nr:3'-5' exonuclease [Streptomyces sp. MNP-20]